ncbi:COP9 signalosome, subunit CSN5 [Phaffia rhodozyma]|uniref:COP9 signalosome complex subunit 5 n=1 Tax=Phaffia rhodozyma TaxID=264483 RepID=A0A0F7SQD7_PHARH|nr:COP9 signalosome, subunit CSN5 [Phaffia rhodozyma]
MASSSSSIAQKTFELVNDIKPLDPSDEIFLYDSEEQKAIDRAAPWKQDPNYFTEVRISAIALIKMVIHARSGGIYEIMGLMQGKVVGRTFCIMDTFALPVQGTETRVNAQAEADGYMVDHLSGSKQVDRPENVVGWYHSHPGYGCWLSGIDVSTQFTNQQYQDPWLAVVIDPNRTISAGKVDIGAFRTYPEGYKSSSSSSAYQSVPLDKIEDFGVHANEYYPLKVSYFKSSLDTKLLDLLWEKYWVKTLSNSPLVTGRAFHVEQLGDLAAKLDQAKSSLQTASRPSIIPPAGKQGKSASTGRTQLREEEEKTALGKAVKDSTRLAMETQHALMAQVLKDQLFNAPRMTQDSSTA